jgi:hypothetical protein
MWWLIAALHGDAEAGKDERQARRELRVVRRHTTTLTTYTDEYWRALRWSDFSRAAGHMADPEHRARWVVAESEAPEVRIQSAEILTITVGPELTEGDHIREAHVLVQIEGYAPKSQMLEKDTRDQVWVLTAAGWFVEPGQEYGVSTRER